MVVFVRVMLYGQGNCPMIRMCVQMSNIASKKSENPLTCHSREAGIQKGYSEQDWIPACAGMTNFSHLRVP